MKITVLDGKEFNQGDTDWDEIRKLGDVSIYNTTFSGQLEERVKDAEILLVNKTEIRKKDILALEKCKMIGVLATGTNNLDLRELAQAGIKVCNVPAYGVLDVAQHAFALLLELSRGVSMHSESVKKGDWQQGNHWCYWLKAPVSLTDLKLGIVGFGAIGQALGRMGHAAGMKVLAWSRSKKAQVDYPFEWRELEQIWNEANVVSLHVPLSAETAKMVNSQNIGRLPDGAFIINTARGGLVDERSVAHALETGKLGGFAADVLNSEPPEEGNPLLTAPNTILTPHMAWATTRARKRILQIMAGNIEAFVAGAPVHMVN